MRSIPTFLLVVALLSGCEKSSSGALKLEVEHKGFRPACVRVVAWDADAPDKRAETTVVLAPGATPLRQEERQGTLTVAVFPGAGWGGRLQVRAEGFERGGCDAQGQVLAQAPTVVSSEEPVVVLVEGRVEQQQLSLSAPDVDGDGYVSSRAGAGSDCEDTREDVHPDAQEVCDGIDNNCVGGEDEGVAAQAWYLDEDGDGHGRADSSVEACASPGVNYVSQGGDCNDGPGGAAIHPGATEVCDGVDNNCVGGEDEGLSTQAWYLDADGDGHGRTDSLVQACRSPGGQYVAQGGDCDDTAAGGAIHPGATEVCDNVDNNCNQSTDEGFEVGASCSAPGECNAVWACVEGGVRACSGTPQASWYPDTDGDNQGTSAGVVQACAQPSGYVSQQGDCNDGDRFTYSGAPEICDARDNDCNTGTNESDACGGGNASLVAASIAGSNLPSGNLRSVALWGDGGVWVVGDANAWLRKVPGAPEFTHGRCPDSATVINWWSVWADPRSGRAYFGGTNGRLAGLSQDSSTCTTDPPMVSDTAFTTRGLHGFELNAGAVRIEGVGQNASGSDSFTWDGQDATQSLRTSSRYQLQDVHGPSMGLLFAVGEKLSNNPFPIYRFNPTTQTWVREPAASGWTVEELYGVHVFSDTLAFAVGEKGSLLRWNGTNWTAIARGTNAPDGNEPLRAVLALGPSSVYVVSAWGNLFRYDGSGWERLASVGNQLYDIAGTRPDDLWVVGSGGRIFHWPK